MQFTYHLYKCEIFGLFSTILLFSICRLHFNVTSTLLQRIQHQSILFLFTLILLFFAKGKHLFFTLCACISQCLYGCSVCVQSSVYTMGEEARLKHPD